MPFRYHQCPTPVFCTGGSRLSHGRGTQSWCAGGFSSICSARRRPGSRCYTQARAHSTTIEGHRGCPGSPAPLQRGPLSARHCADSGEALLCTVLLRWPPSAFDSTIQGPLLLHRLSIALSYLIKDILLKAFTREQQVAQGSCSMMRSCWSQVMCRVAGPQTCSGGSRAGEGS